MSHGYYRDPSWNIGNVDNTTDLQKPLSYAAVAANAALKSADVVTSTEIVALKAKDVGFTNSISELKSVDLELREDVNLNLSLIQKLDSLNRQFTLAGLKIMDSSSGFFGSIRVNAPSTAAAIGLIEYPTGYRLTLINTNNNTVDVSCYSDRTTTGSATKQSSRFVYGSTATDSINLAAYSTLNFISTPNYFIIGTRVVNNFNVWTLN